MKAMYTIGLALALAGLLPAAQEPAATGTPAPQAEAAPAYECADAGLEAGLADLKAQAEAGDAAAAQAIYSKYACERHFDQARAWCARFAQMLEAKAEAGDVPAMLTLADMYRSGFDYIAADNAKSVKWYSRAMEAGDPRAAAFMGAFLKEQGDAAGSAAAYAKAYAACAKDAEGGDVQALYWQGAMLMGGLGVQADPAGGIALMERAAEQGCKQAVERLFSIYFKGTGTKADHAKALHYARLSADQGDGRMAYAAYCMFSQGQGTPVDEALADHYLDIAAAANIHSAILARAGRLKQAGKEAEAFPYFNQGASMGIVPCMTEAGIALLHGRAGQIQDEARGIALLERASDSWDFCTGDSDRAGAATAAYELACYYRDKEVPELADQWFVIASDHGHPAAFARRGLLHLDPFSDLTWDPTTAYRFWVSGRDAGDDTCRLYLNLFYYVFTPLLVIVSFALPMFVVRRLAKKRAHLYKDDDDDKPAE